MEFHILQMASELLASSEIKYLLHKTFEVLALTLGLLLVFGDE